jgi:arylsulfatase
MVGKWRVGDNISPLDRGFDNFYGWVRGYGVDSWEPRMMTRLPAAAPHREYAAGEFFATDGPHRSRPRFLETTSKLPLLRGCSNVAYQAHPTFPFRPGRTTPAATPKSIPAAGNQIRDRPPGRQKKLGLIPPDTSLPPRSAIPLPAVARRLGSATSNGNNPAWDALDEPRRADLTHRMAAYCRHGHRHGPQHRPPRRAPA